MSTTREGVQTAMHAACLSCYELQLQLLEAAQMVSAPTSKSNLQLVLQYATVSQLTSFPTIREEQMTTLATIQTELDEATDLDQLRPLRARLIIWIGELHEEDLSQETIEARPRTENGLNKRMRDALFQMKAKIRNTRRRLFDAGEEYDKAAFISTRNQLFLSWGVYMEQLRLDLLTATNAECAEVEQIRLPAIENASGNTFVESLKDLRDFIQTRVLPGEKA